MARSKPLTDAELKALAKQPGFTNDSHCLYFQVTASLSASWICRFYRDGDKVPRSMGLGAYPKVSGRKARLLRDEALKLRDAGHDPIDARKVAKQVASNALTVKDACEAYLAAQRARFRTERHVKQIKQRLRDFVYPQIGDMAIADIKAAEARLVLAPIWTEKHKTAGRVRQYMEDVTDWAIHEGVRTDENNPFEVKRLRFAFPQRIHKTKSHASLPFEEAPTLIAELRKQNTVKSLALQFIMLCAVRVGDIVGGGKEHSEPMKWSHIDLKAASWTVPDTKMGRPHVVPLSDPAMRVLAEMQRFRDPSTDYVFPGSKSGSCLNDATLRYLLRDMGYAGRMTVHGARAMFKTWAEEQTNHPAGVVEAALAHVKDKLALAYHRGSYLQKRQALMQDWGSFLGGREAKVIQLPKRA